MRKWKDSTQDRQKPFSEFQQAAAVETCDKFPYKSFLKPCLYLTWFTFIEFVFKLVVACFWVARVIKNTVLRKPFEFKWPEVHFNRKQTSMRHIINYLLSYKSKWKADRTAKGIKIYLSCSISLSFRFILTKLPSSSRTGEYWLSVVL